MKALVNHGPGNKAWGGDTRSGADITINNGREDPLEIVRELTDGLGEDEGQ
jgi:hypothetical protein